MEKYKQYVTKEIREDENFNIFSEIEITKYKRDAYALLKDFEKYQEYQDRVEFLQYQLLFCTINEN